MKKLTLLALLAASGSAFAHVTLEAPTAASGGYYKGVLKIGHGCNGSPTTAISVEMPEGVRLVQPMPKAGWEVEVSKAAVKPFDNYGRKVSEDVNRITWKGGKLPSNFYDEFVFQAKIAAQPGKLYFKVKQQCEQGETNWADIPVAGQDSHDLKSPAAELTVTAGVAGHHH